MDLASAPWALEACGDSSGVPSTISGRTFPARVPGCVHSDLIRAGVIGHPNIGFNEDACQWIGRANWRYRCQFELDAAALGHDRIDLVLDGLDTVARIELNGRHVGDSQTMNMHHAHRLGCEAVLQAGANDLVISLRGPVAYVEEQERRLGQRPVNGDWTPYSYIRKMASNFQWDWGPKVATCGIWRGARLEAWNKARIAAVRPRVLQASNTAAVVRIEVDVDGTLNGVRLLARLSRSGSSQEAEFTPDSGMGKWVADLTIERPALWWPRGCGPQPLYDLEVEVLVDDRVIDVWNRRLGLRETRLTTQPDEHGESFAISVNGVPIFCKGANWIPEGLFPEDQSPQRIRERVQQAAEANMNMLRVWGGGTYEQDAFYDACDELGILVWQDFMFACATYPEDDPYPALIEREAREAVSRLAHHPSIVLWCGGNEDVLGFESWGWKERMTRDQTRGGWGERYYFDVLPRVVQELDPSRPYWPDSPHSAATRTSLHPNDPGHGDRHTWDAKVEGYRSIVPRFCSEFGHQSPPCWATMKEAWGEDQLRLGSRAMEHRQRATGGNDVWYGSQVMGGRFREPRPPSDFDDWLYQAHLLQARAISIGIEWMRANQPRCMGALFWQFNDAWAGHSWSCVDSAGRKKPLWYAVQRSFAPRLVTIQPFNGEPRLCVVNESREKWSTDFSVRRVRLDGAVLAEHIASATVLPGQCWRSPVLRELVGAASDEVSQSIVAAPVDAEIDRAWWFFQHDVRLKLPKPRLHATITRADAGHCDLEIRADALIRDGVFAVDRVDPEAEVDSNLFTLLPAERRTVRIRTKLDLPASAWISPPVFRCANEFSDVTDRV